MTIVLHQQQVNQYCLDKSIPCRTFISFYRYCLAHLYFHVNGAHAGVNRNMVVPYQTLALLAVSYGVRHMNRESHNFVVPMILLTTRTLELNLVFGVSLSSFALQLKVTIMNKASERYQTGTGRHR